MQKLTDIVTLITKGHWQVVPPQTVDTLQAEIDRLEKHLAYQTPRRPLTQSKLLELQKFMDLAG